MKTIFAHHSILHIFVTLMLMMAGLLFLLSSHQLTAAIFPSSLNGIETRMPFKEEMFSFKATTIHPLIITGLYRTCHSTCPANISLLRQVNAQLQNEMRYLFIALKPDEDSSDVLTTYLNEFKPHMQLYMPADKQALIQAMKGLPENYSNAQSDVHHSGNIYLYHPNAKGLVVYRSPTSQQIFDDLLTLQSRGN